MKTPGESSAGHRMYGLVEALYPLCRSITGAGVRETLAAVGRHIPLELSEVPSGTAVLDWTIPEEWNIREAWIRGPDGTAVVDFAHHSLHVVGYSEPVRARLSLDELLPHLHTLPEHPTWIPYRTSYYNRTWGFCLPQATLERLQPGTYEVCIDASLTQGSLTYAECLLPGRIEDEVLFSAHTCHPSLANDNLSGIAVLTELARRLGDVERRYTYRFLFAPGTIGSITWLARNRERAGRIRHGLVVSCVGDGGGPFYKRSRLGNAPIDRIMAHVLAHGPGEPVIEDFFPYGYDERQYCSPGFNLPVGLFERSKYGTFPEYHTSADNLSLVSPTHLEESLEVLWRAVDVLETDRTPVNLQPYGEPQLGRRGLYQAIGGNAHKDEMQMAMLWVLNLADGSRTLLDIAETSGLPFAVVSEVCDLLVARELVRIG